MEDRASLGKAQALGAAADQEVPVSNAAQATEDADTARLVLRFKSGDERAFDALYERYLSRIYGYMRVALNDSYEAEDAAHEIFIKVLEAMPAYEVRETPFRVWLFKIVRNYTINHLIKASRIEVTDPDEINRLREAGTVVADFGASAPPAEVELIRRLDDHELLHLIERLPLPQKQVIVLRYVLDFSINDIAQAIDRTPNAVSLLQQRAFRVLRERLIALGRAPDSCTEEEEGGETISARMPMRMLFFGEATVAQSRRLAIAYASQY